MRKVRVPRGEREKVSDREKPTFYITQSHDRVPCVVAKNERESRKITHMIENKVMHAACIFRLDDRRKRNKVVLCSKVEVERFAPV